ncbi:DUF4388 domain-containing protein [bacterium]|nr:DUF4388 domain-containing protein [candidate division CSSED10-310 bacterium]
MSLSGSFEGMPPQDLLEWIARGKKSGVLTASNTDQKQNIFFHDGNVVGVTSSKSKDRLGALLVRKGYLTQEQLVQFRNIQIDKSEQLGTLLEKKNIVSGENLKQVLSEQVMEVYFDLMNWKEGQFTFEERDLLDNEKIVDVVNSSNLLLEGARRIDELRRNKEMLPQENSILKRADNGKIDTYKNGLEQKIWELLDKPRLLKEITCGLNASEFNIMDALHKMMSEGCIVRDEKLEKDRAAVSSQIEQNMNQATELMEHQGYHESIAILRKILEIDKTCAPAETLLRKCKKHIIHDAKRMIESPDIIPKIRHSFSSLSPAKLPLTAEEGFVYSRIDGRTSVKSLKYLTNMEMETIYIMLHKFSRMGLIYLEKLPPRRKSNQWVR